MGISEENTALGKPGNRQGDDIKIYLNELWWEWTGFIWVRTGTCGSLSGPQYTSERSSLVRYICGRSR